MRVRVVTRRTQTDLTVVIIQRTSCHVELVTYDFLFFASHSYPHFHFLRSRIKWKSFKQRHTLFEQYL
jgi:hypothetical protein